MATGTLTAAGLKSAAPGKHFDGGGLFLHVTPTRSRLWRLKYRFAGKEKLLALGAHPEVTLAEARLRRDEARRQLRDGIDPLDARREKKRSDNPAETFKVVADEWLDRQRAGWSPLTATKAEWLFSLVPGLHNLPVTDLTAPVVLQALRKIESAGTLETAHRVKARIGQVMRYAVATGRAQADPVASLRGALAPVVTRSHSAVTDPAAIGGLLRALWGYNGQPVTLAALKLSAFTFARPGELRAMEWSEIDFDAAQWRLPAARMKMKREHIVPLSTQAVEILRALQPLTGRGRFVFPNSRHPGRCLSENTVNAAMQSAGITGEQHVAHGFRATASTVLAELGWNSDVIERQLAHIEPNSVKRAYNRAAHLPERVKMMQAWADHLDHLRERGTLVLLKRKRP